MFQITRKITAFFMAFVVLISTMSFAVNLHFCGGNLVETALFSKAEGCGMEMQNPSTDGCSITKANCCNDEQLVINGQDELKLRIDTLSFENQVFLASYIYTYINGFEALDKNLSSFKTYKPPLVIKQIYKLDETYLI